MTDTLFDRAITWLEANPKAIPIIFAMVVLAVGYFDTIPGAIVK